jgi:hypothetical protein
MNPLESGNLEVPTGIREMALWGPLLPMEFQLFALFQMKIDQRPCE